MLKKTNERLENRYYCHHCDDLVTIGLLEERLEEETVPLEEAIRSIENEEKL